jgi:anti-anti-sigma factor
MKIKQSESQEGITLTVEGRLMGSKEPTIELFETLSLVVNKNPQRILLDFENVDLIDSMSIGLLIGFFLKCNESNIKYRFIKISQAAAEILERANIKMVFPGLW